VVEGNGEVHLTGYFDPSESSPGSQQEESLEQGDLLKKAQKDAKL
jgi:hypothetical protein